MGKQPIDDLFKRKLNDAEITPGKTAWTAMQGKLGKRQITPLWAYVSIAASLLIVGMFGWWALRMHDDAISAMPITDKTESVRKSQSDSGNQQIVSFDTGKDTSPKNISPSLIAEREMPKADADQKLMNHIRTIRPTLKKTSAEGKVKQEKTTVISDFDVAQLNVSQAALQQKLLEPKSAMSVAITQQKMPSQVTVERTLVVSFESLASVGEKLVQADDILENSTNKSGLSSLISRVKKIKDGDAFATSVTKSARSPRRGFGKFYDNVKESIQNNTAD